jgi:Mn-dependent DtxR family transcriptional regulator
MGALSMSQKPSSKPKRSKCVRKSALNDIVSSRRLSANMEDYIETIYKLTQEHGISRVSSIAEVMGVKQPSVSKALRRLQRDGLVTHLPYGGATVTALGQKVAKAQVLSHRALTRFLQDVLALQPELADHDACQIEHAISPATVKRLMEFIEYLGLHEKEAVTRFRQGLKLTSKEKSRTQRTWISRV